MIESQVFKPNVTTIAATSSCAGQVPSFVPTLRRTRRHGVGFAAGSLLAPSGFYLAILVFFNLFIKFQFDPES